MGGRTIFPFSALQSDARAVRMRTRRVRRLARRKEHGDAPQPRRAHNGIQHAGNQRRLPAEQEGNQVKTETSRQAPS